MFTDGDYIERNRTKTKFILDSLGTDFFNGKSVLDMGAGFGGITSAFGRLVGSGSITACDGRGEHLKVLQKTHPNIKIVKADLDKEFPFKKVDVILDLDLLCHLKHWEAHLKNICNSTTYLILETAVCDSDDPNMVATLTENKNIYDASLNGFASLPSAANIERILSECGMTYKRHNNPKLNTHDRIYDWKVANTNACDTKNRRFWIATKHGTELKPKVIPDKNQETVLSSWSEPAQKAEPMSKYLIEPRTGRMPKSVPAEPLAPSSQPFQPLKFTTRLFYPYYEDTNPQKKRDIDQAFQKNIDNLTAELIVIGGDARLTFNEVFEKINLLAQDDDISVICNPNVYLDRTIAASQNIQPKEVYALNGGASSPIAWIMKGKVVGVVGDFVIGEQSSGTKIAEAFAAAGYTVSSPTSIASFKVGGIE